MGSGGRATTMSGNRAFWGIFCRWPVPEQLSSLPEKLMAKSDFVASGGPNSGERSKIATEADAHHSGKCRIFLIHPPEVPKVVRRKS